MSLFSGLGYWTALDLAKRGARVILACRNLQKAEEAKNKILKELSDGGDVVVRHLDLSSMWSVRQFARETYEQESRLDILINNAAVSSESFVLFSSFGKLIIVSHFHS